MDAGQLQSARHVGMRNWPTAEGLSLPAVGLQSLWPCGASIRAERGGTGFVRTLTAPDSARAMQNLRAPTDSAASHTYSSSRSGLAVPEGCSEPQSTTSVSPPKLEPSPRWSLFCLARALAPPGSAGGAVGTATHTVRLLLEPGHAAENTCQAQCPSHPAAPG